MKKLIFVTTLLAITSCRQQPKERQFTFVQAYDSNGNKTEFESFTDKFELIYYTDSIYKSGGDYEIQTLTESEYMNKVDNERMKRKLIEQNLKYRP